MKKQILAILAAFACALAEAEVVARVVTNKAGVPQIRVNGEVVRPRMFWGWRGDVLYDQVRLAASNGVDFVSFMAEKSAWRGENDYDWSELDAKCTAILNANPKALLIPRMKLETSGWWARKHPADVVTYGGGTKVDVPSISCRAYRRQGDAGKHPPVAAAVQLSGLYNGHRQLPVKLIENQHNNRGVQPLP